METKRGPIARFKNWFSGSIRHKLTFFVVMFCLLLIGMLSSLVGNLLVPAYNNFVHRELNRSLQASLDIMNEAEAEGTQMIEESVAGGQVQLRLSETMRNRFIEASRSGTVALPRFTIDISSATGQNLWWHGTYTQSKLYPAADIWTGFEGFGTVYESDLAVQYRAYIQQNGSLYDLIDDRQMVVGGLTADGQYVVMLSTGLDRISEAVKVLNSLLLPIAGVLICVAVLCVWLFSRWFTKPVLQLSDAAQQMARGNYNVTVPESGEDEIGNLARDFNHMAREVKRSTELQKDLIANVSHDLRTPLTLIKGYAETVRDLSGDDPAKRQQQLSVIVDETDRLSALVGSVLELSRLSSGNEKPNVLRFDLADLCEEIAGRYQEHARSNGLNFHYISDGSANVMADPRMVERALHNLLANAVKHVGADGYIGLTLAHTPENTVRVTVEDHGPGIEPADLPHLFDRYYRARADAGKPGTGLGLSIAKAAFEASGFPYGVDSTPGRGASFWFEAPLAPQAPARPVTAPAGPNAEAPASGNATPGSPA